MHQTKTVLCTTSKEQYRGSNEGSSSITGVPPPHPWQGRLCSGAGAIRCSRRHWFCFSCRWWTKRNLVVRTGAICATIHVDIEADKINLFSGWHRHSPRWGCLLSRGLLSPVCEGGEVLPAGQEVQEVEVWLHHLCWCFGWMALPHLKNKCLKFLMERIEDWGRISRVLLLLLWFYI